MKTIKSQLIDAIVLLGYDQSDIKVGYPLIPEHGDYSVNIAMVVAKKMKRPPVELAKNIADELNKNQFVIESFGAAKVVPPGFINFHLTKNSLFEILNNIIKSGDIIGSSKIGHGKKVVLEHTNVNPNKALHVGHLRNACLGSAVEKILETMGYDVEVQNYIDDTGVQVAVTSLGLRELGIGRNDGEKYDHYTLRVYVEAMSAIETQPEFTSKLSEITHALDKQEGEIKDFTKKMTRRVLYENLKTAYDFGIEYDLLPWESDIIASGFWKRAFEILKHVHCFEKVESGDHTGCWVIKDVMGDDKVIVKSNGVVTYTGKDIAYHLWKFNVLGKDFRYAPWPDRIQEKPLWTTGPDGKPSHRFGKADIVVNFIDVRQSFPQQAVKDCLNALGFTVQSEHLNHVAYGVVSLSSKTAQSLGLDTSDNKNRYAMSGRKGIGVLADDLLDAVAKQVALEHPDSPSSVQVAVGAIKYYMLKFSTESDLTFDYTDALNIYGNSGPYLQYTHARCTKILEKGGFADPEMLADFSFDEMYDHINAEELSILRWLHRFPERIQAAGESFDPSILCSYLYEIAQRFNTFYNNHHVLDAETDMLKKFRARVVFATALILKKGLTVLGITPLLKM